MNNAIVLVLFVLLAAAVLIDWLLKRRLFVCLERTEPELWESLDRPRLFFMGTREATLKAQGHINSLIWGSNGPKREPGKRLTLWIRSTEIIAGLLFAVGTVAAVFAQ